MSMVYEDFEIHARPYIINAYCRGCGTELKEVSNGFLSHALFCPKCESVYLPKIMKVPKKKISAGYIKQCRDEVANKLRRRA